MIKIFHLPVFYLHQQRCKWIKKILLSLLSVQVFLLPAVAQNITRPNIQGPSGLQVNSFTGSLYYQRRDLFVPGRVLSLDISFTYSSVNRASDWGYGYGWTFNYNRFYTANDTSVTFYNSDGRRDVYKKSGTDYIAPVGIFDKIINYATGKFKLVTKDGTVYYFDDATHKKLTKIIERNNNQLSLSYTGSVLSSITEASGRTITFTWIASRLSQVKADFSGAVKTIDYTYDAAGTLKSVKDPLGNIISYTYIRGRLMGSLTDGNSNTTNILYTNNNAVSKLISCEGEKSISYNEAELKTYATDRNSDNTFVTTYTFNNAWNLVSKSGNCCGYNTTYSYDEDNNINQLKDANGHTTVYTYDARGNLISETDPLNQTVLYTYESTFNKITSITDKRGNKTEYTYDSRGNLLQVKEPLNTITNYTYDNNGDMREVTDPKSNKTSLSYDSYGNLITIKDALNGITALTYDVWGNRLSQKDANNHTSTFVYDALNRITLFTGALGNINTYVYDANGNLLSVKDANNNTSGYIYDSKDNPLIVTDAAGNNTIMQYDAVGNMIAFTDAKGNKTAYTYDKQSRLISATNAAGDKLYYSYDGIGNKTGIMYANGNLVATEYDAFNRVTKVTDKLGSVTTYQYDANSNRIAESDAKGNTTTYTYDALNRPVTKTDPLGNAYNYTYDLNDNITIEKDRNGNTTAYTYDTLNRITKMTDAGGYATTYTYDAVGNKLSVTDAKGNTTAYTYDALDRTTGETFADNTTTTYTYDAEGNILTYKNNNGQITSYNYDKLYRPVSKTYPGGVDSLSYDATGHLTKAKNSSANVLFNYDNAYRIINENLNGKITGHSYNIAAGTIKIIYPGGRVVERKLDERTQLQSIKEGAVSIATYDYNNAGENTGRHYANGTSTAMQYNANNQVKSLTANPSGFIDFGYTYDKEENPLSTAFRHRTVNSEQYNYDTKNQLIQFKKGSSQQTAYNYDGVGNRATMQVNGITTTYTANSINAYTTITQSIPANYTYDANGNTLTNGTQTFTYDIDNRLTTVDAGTTAIYTYDALGRRIKKVTAAGTVSYYFDGFQVIEERNALNTVLASYVWGSWLDDIVSMKRNGNTYYYHTNTIGSVAAVTDSSGTVAERYEYDAFGKVSFFNSGYTALMQSAIGNNYTYTGRAYEPETGNFDYRARQYDALHGHFQQRDPIGYYSGDYNLYAYVGNKPTGFVDPFGLAEENCKQPKKLPPPLNKLKHLKVPVSRHFSKDLITGEDKFKLKPFSASIEGDKEKGVTIKVEVGPDFKLKNIAGAEAKVGPEITINPGSGDASNLGTIGINATVKAYIDGLFGNKLVDQKLYEYKKRWTWGIGQGADKAFGQGAQNRLDEQERAAGSN